jgi:hypothetical protein
VFPLYTCTGGKEGKHGNTETSETRRSGRKQGGYTASFPTYTPDVREQSRPWLVGLNTPVAIDIPDNHVDALADGVADRVAARLAVDSNAPDPWFNVKSAAKHVNWRALIPPLAKTIGIGSA